MRILVVANAKLRISH